MPQSQAWENEYRNSKLVTKNPEPQNDVLRFFKFLKKEKIQVDGLKVLDLGCGTGRNSNYFSEKGNEVIGIDISRTAIEIAQTRANEMKVDDKVKYIVGDIGARYPFENDYFDLVLDITSSNSLNEKERDIYLNEIHRTLRSKGYLFVRALCKEGDKNAKNLIKISPGPEYDTYKIKELDLIERVFTEKDFRDLYGKYFEIKKLMKKSGYARFQGQNYKRNYFLAYLQKI